MGRIVDEMGNFYIGEWKNGKSDGFGKKYTQNLGKTAYGQFK